MYSVILPGVPLVANTWTLLVLPDKCRDNIRFQADSLGVLEYSFDAGVTYLKTVGAGEVLYGNFSTRSIWFRVTSADTVKVAIQDKSF